MLKLYDLLRAGKTGIYPDIWTALAARALFADKFEHTDGSDYIFDGNSIIYYIGTATRPEVPAMLGANAMDSAERTSFTGNTEIEAVKLPDGMEVIE